ncbi:MAG: hypothetical protein IGS39_09505 [Calothrix sp. C42_A2020_038]|nr:hypothetical protein [Calothrix sp. C42_A2020_038]
MKTEKLVGEALRLPTNAISYVVSHKLAVMYPEKALLETEDWAFDLQNYFSEKIYTLTDKISIHNQININWDTTEKQILKSVENA